MIKSIEIGHAERLGYAHKRFDLDEESYDLGYLGNTESLKVYCEVTKYSSYVDVYVVDEMDCSSRGRPRVVANIVMSKHIGVGLPTYSTYYTRIDYKYAGFDLAPKLYEFLLTEYEGWALKAGTTQSPGGKSIWNRLAKSRKVEVIAYNKDTGEVYPCKFSKDGEVECDVDVYSDKHYHLYARRRSAA